MPLQQVRHYGSYATTAVLPLQSVAVMPLQQVHHYTLNKLRQWNYSSYAITPCGSYVTTGGTPLYPKAVTPITLHQLCHYTLRQLCHYSSYATTAGTPLQLRHYSRYATCKTFKDSRHRSIWIYISWRVEWDISVVIYTKSDWYRFSCKQKNRPRGPLVSIIPEPLRPLNGLGGPLGPTGGSEIICRQSRTFWEKWQYGLWDILNLWCNPPVDHR